ncbi:MAG: hypothetical protein NC240_11155 [Clostridium sp.]|nr:hypothetical protein [Clostridium sp.]
MKKFILTMAVMAMTVGFTGCTEEKQSEAEVTTEAVATTEATEETTTEATTEALATTEAEVEAMTTESVSTKPAGTTSTTSTKPQQSTTTQTTQAPAPVQTTTQAPSTTEAPAPATTQHQHTWATRTKVVKEAWTEIVEHPAVTHTERHNVCSMCGFVDRIDGDIFAHQDQYQTTDVSHAICGYHSATITITDQAAWTETIEHPAETKTVEYCTGCGIEK